nr:zinc finger, CCHC-type [Tanacetum cinerariifolium]
MDGNTVKDMTTNFGKLDKFEGHDFRRWQKKMHFLLTTLKVIYVLTTPMPELLEDATVEAIRIRAKWENDDYICRGHILNGMSDSLFDVYTNVESAKELWDSLESKYVAEDSLSKKFLSLTYKGSLRAQDSDKGKGKEVGGPSVNMTEEGKNKHNKQNKDKKQSNKNNSGSSSNKKPKLKCWKCGKTGHFKRDCRSGNKKNANAGGSGKGSKDHSQDQGQNLVPVWNSFVKYSVSLISEAFYTYEPMKDGSVLYMGDDHYSLVHGKGSVALEFSFGKTITLFNVLYVPKLCKNLVSGPVLNKCGYKQVYESDKYILLKSGYVHYKRRLEMSKDDLIPTIDENPEKCTTYDASSFCYVYLLYAKDEALINLEFIQKGRSEASRPEKEPLGEKIDCIFAGYDEHSKAYRDDHSDVISSEVLEPRKGKRARKAKSDGSDFRLYLVEGSRDQVGSQYSYCYSIEEDPRTYNEAMQSRDSTFWKEAIDDEIGYIMENNTWVLSDLPLGCKPLGCKRIFKKKMKVYETIDKFKSRLVIQGFRQKKGIDYFDTYAPVARITTIRLLLALAAIHNLVIHQMDVKTAFLNGDLEEENKLMLLDDVADIMFRLLEQSAAAGIRERNMTKVIDGVVQPVAPTIAEKKLARKNELKARGTLLMALPDKHQLKFNIHTDAKTLMEEIEKRFEWRTHTLIWRNKTNLENQSLDDLFNSHKIYEVEVKSSSSASTSTQNIIFVSSQNTDSTHESVSVIASVSAAGAKVSIFALPNVDTLSDAVIYSFFANGHVDYESKEISLKDRKEWNYFNWFDMSKLECYTCNKKRHFARECSVVMWAAMTGAFRKKNNRPTMRSWHLPPQVLPFMIMNTHESVSVIASVSAATAKVSIFALPNVDTLSDAVIYSFFANGHVDYESKEISLKDRKEWNYFNWFDMSKLECYTCNKKRHFARECMSPKDTRRNVLVEPQRRNVHVETSTSNALVLQCGGVGSMTGAFRKKNNRPTMRSWHLPPQVLLVMIMK